MVCVFIGASIEKNGRLSISDTKEAVKGGVQVTFVYFAFWIGIALVIYIIIFFLKVINLMPRNY